MTKLQIALFCLSILIILIVKSNASPIDGSRSNDEKWLSRSKLSNEDTWKTYTASKSPKFRIPDSLAVKLKDPNFRADLNKLLNDANIERQKSAINDDSSSPKAVQSLYPKCDDFEDDSDEENKLIKESKLLPLYYDIQSSLISNPTNTIFKSNLRVYLKKNVNDCDCKLDADDDLLQLSLYETSSIVSFHPVKEVPKRQLIESVKFNRCCDQLITFDLTQQVQKWKMYSESNKGLQLKLTDNQGNMLNVEDYIQLMNCSDKSPPMPYIKMIHPNLPNMLKHIKKYPTLDVAYNHNDINLFAIKNSQQLMDDDRADKDANV